MVLHLTGKEKIMFNILEKKIDKGQTFKFL